MKRQKNKRKTVFVQPKDKTQWHKGRLCSIKNKALFIKPTQSLPEGFTDKDVYLNPDNISKYVLPVKGGDAVEFVLGDRNKARPMARKVKISQYSQRTSEDLIDYIKELTENLKSADCRKVLMETLPNTAMWSFFGSPNFMLQAGMQAGNTCVYLIQNCYFSFYTTLIITLYHKNKEQIYINQLESDLSNHVVLVLCLSNLFK